MTRMKSGIITIAAIASAVQGQLNFEALRNLHLKQNRNGSPQPSIFEQVEFMQTAVSSLQSYLHSGQNEFNPGTGDHLWQYLQKGPLGDFMSCQACWYTASEAQTYLSNALNVQSLEKQLVSVCSMFMREVTCQGFIDSCADVVLSNLLAVNLKPDFLCTEALDMCPAYDSGFVELNETLWQDQIMATKPANLMNDDFIDKLYQEIAADPNRDQRPILKFMHFTDIHMDPYYEVGASKTCSDVICCRAVDGFPTDPSLQAGPLGTFGCDVPLDVVTTMGELVNEEIKPDVILWTGDIVPHDQNSYTFEYVSGLQERLADFFKANLSSYQLYPLEGNHDFVTPNSQDFSTPDPMLAFNLEQWDQYLDANAKAIYAKAGYYTQKLQTKDATTGESKTIDNVNIVAINTEACYVFNFYLMSQRNDPGGVLAWLNETLAGFEERGEIAILIGHHPPGASDCLYQWSLRFHALLDRYQHIVRWSVYGHVHLEIYNVAKGIKTGKPTGVHYWAGSVSTWFEVNPSFKVYEVDALTMLPIKSHTYFLDVEGVKDQNKLKWKWAHETTALYNMPDLSPSSFVAMAEQVKQSEDMALLYQSTQSNGGNQTKYDACDESCRENLYCSITNTVYLESKDCMGLPRYDIRSDPISTMMEYLSDPWVVKKPAKAMKKFINQKKQ